MAAATLLLTQQRQGPQIACQLLLYPSVHAAAETESKKQFAEGYALDKAVSTWMWQNYVGSHDARDPLISPMLAEDLSFMPPALIVAASHDPLRDEAKLYADRLRKEGVACEYKCYEGMLHGFLNHTYMLPVNVGQAAMADIARHLRRQLNLPTGNSTGGKL